MNTTLRKMPLAKADPRLKNRVGGFGSQSSDCIWSKSSQVLETESETSVSVTITVSGLPFWPNRDPIGERVGTHLYVFVANDSINDVDPFGLHPLPGRTWPAIQYHTTCLNGHKHVWMGRNWSTQECRDVPGSGSATECVHGSYWTCVAHCEMQVILGEVATDVALAAAKKVVTQAAKGVAKKWALKGIPVVGTASTVYSGLQAIKCLTDCTEKKH